jgi:hypothetical protein
LKERILEALPDPVQLIGSELAFVAGGQAISFVNQLNDARVSIGKYDTVVTDLSFVTAAVVGTPIMRSARNN